MTPAWADEKAAWKASAEAQLKSPLGDLRPALGQSCASRGSWTLYNEQPAYRAYIDNGMLFVGVSPLNIADIWALADGEHVFSRLVNNKTSAMRFVIVRERAKS